MSKAKAKTELIKASLKLFGHFYHSQGKTVEEVLTKLKPPIAKGFGILILEKGDKRREKIIRANIINGVFGQRSPTMKSIALKNITTLFEDFNRE